MSGMKSKLIITTAILIMCVAAVGANAKDKKPSKADVAAGKAAEADLRGIVALNNAMKVATETMDNVATMALWDDSGATLLPGQAAVQGKANIAKWLDGVTANLKGWKVVKQEQEFQDI